MSCGRLAAKQGAGMTLKHLVLGAIFVASLLGGPAIAVEEPTYKTVMKVGAFEIRDYPALCVAEVTVTGDRSEAANQGFRLLAGYIFGGNKRQQSLAMTAPVAQIPASQAPEKIPMTAPVTEIQGANAWLVRFTMPSTYTLDTLPIPNDPRVRLLGLPPTRFAVIRFSGLVGQDTIATQTKVLNQAIKTHQLRPTGKVSLAQYNPPWTLWFMRRNEVMIEVAR